MLSRNVAISVICLNACFGPARAGTAFLAEDNSPDVGSRSGPTEKGDTFEMTFSGRMIPIKEFRELFKLGRDGNRQPLLEALKKKGIVIVELPEAVTDTTPADAKKYMKYQAELGLKDPKRVVTYPREWVDIPHGAEIIAAHAAMKPIEIRPYWNRDVIVLGPGADRLNLLSGLITLHSGVLKDPTGKTVSVGGIQMDLKAMRQAGFAARPFNRDSPEDILMVLELAEQQATLNFDIARFFHENLAEEMTESERGRAAAVFKPILNQAEQMLQGIPPVEELRRKNQEMPEPKLNDAIGALINFETKLWAARKWYERIILSKDDSSTT